MKRLFGQKPDSLPAPVSPTREFCVAVFTSKQLLLRLVPRIIPTGDASLFRFVLEHGDYGIHNMSIAPDADGNHHVTSVFDWDVGSIVPAFLSDPSICVGPDLGTDGNASPLAYCLGEDTTPKQVAEYASWAKAYCKV